MSLLKPRSALPEESPSDTPPLKLPWWTKGDTNAFFGLGFRRWLQAVWSARRAPGASSALQTRQRS